SDILVCKNINFDTVAPKPHLGIITAAGELPIGTGNTSPTPEILAGSITSPNGSITVGYSSPDITLEVASDGFTWNEVTGTSQELSVNKGYIGNNAGTITMTLPETALIGDTICFAQKGTGIITVA